jgi:hypothetical protein
MRGKIYILILVAVLLFVVGWTRSAPREMWEYKVVVIFERQTEMEQGLNKLGSEGWELAAYSPLSNGSSSGTFIFKRPK